MAYTKETIKKIVKENKNNLKNIFFIFVLNDNYKTAKEGKFISFNKKYIKIKNDIHGIHKIVISDIKNIVTVVN